LNIQTFRAKSKGRALLFLVSKKKIETHPFAPRPIGSFGALNIIKIQNSKNSKNYSPPPK